MSRNIVVFLLAVVAAGASASADLVKNMSIKFVKELDTCIDELEIKDAEPIVLDIRNFWQEDSIMSDYRTGCVVYCLATKSELLDEDGYLQHHKMKEFVQTEGDSDEETAADITALIQSCLDNSIPDACNRSVAAAQCVKLRMMERTLAPPGDLMAEEILADDGGK